MNTTHHTTGFGPHARRAKTAAMLLGFLGGGGWVGGASAPAQPVAFISHFGQNTAYCGPLGGPFVQHNFTTTDPTHDAISISDPGGPTWSPSNADSQLDEVPSPLGLTLALTGSAMRGANLGTGVSAVADARTNWEFTLAAPACFTYSLSFSAGGSNGVIAGQGYAFVANGAGGQIIPDPGTLPDTFGGGLSVPSTIVRTATGTLRAGRYVISMVGRVDGNNAAPYSGSFAHLMTLRILPTCCAADFNADGFVNSADFFDFLTAFFTDPPAPAADFNHDTFINSQDFFDFLAAFFGGGAGC